MYQPKPSASIYSIGIRGLIFHEKDTSSFAYNIWYRGKKKPIGWLDINAKRISCVPVSYQYKRKGKLRRAKYNFITGFLLNNNDMVYAALDQAQQHGDVAYLNNQLSEDEKLIIAAYLFIVACYQ